MSKITSSSADYQTFPTLFELEPVAGKKETVDFSAPELSSLGGLTLVREYGGSTHILSKKIVQEYKMIPYALITDNGKTVFHGVPTVTHLGIGPYFRNLIR